ncbi:MAG: PEGA domain-containing protein [Polyangiaceae bacterium]
MPNSRKAALALGAVTLLAGAFWLTRGSAERTTTSEPPAAGTTLSTQRISRALRVEATPREARIFVDEQPATNPVMVSVEAGSEHVVRVEREGYESSIRKLRVLDDVDMRIDLAVMQQPAEEPAGPTRSKKARQAAASTRVVAPLPAAAPVKPVRAPVAGKNCDPPYFFSNGNKTYKPECL